MERMIAYCGLVCTDCSSYAATQADDAEALERVAAQWREEYGAEHATADTVTCDGCVVQGRKSYHCGECNIRACGVARGVANCAHCADYACEQLVEFFGFVPDARAVLDEVRAGLG